ncbi:MAG: hypothetical protein AAGA03_05005, partial [Planctomycetota bacterium]
MRQPKAEASNSTHAFRLAVATLILAAVTLVVFGLFRGVILGNDRLAFRDVSHFYHPLYDYLRQRTASEWLPAWNSLDQTGIPLWG